MLDAETTLARISVNGWPTEELFDAHVGSCVATQSRRHGHVVAFGEMVALLWKRGERAAAVQLEGLWNQLASRASFSLYCAYPMHDCASSESMSAFRAVCDAHSAVIPAHVHEIGEESDRMRELALLQQRAASLEQEVAVRRRVEALLADRERELADLLENAIYPLHKVGPDGTILWANRAELDMLGYAHAEYIGHNIADFHEDRQGIGRVLERLAAGESLRDYPARVRCRDGTIRHVLISSNALRENGKLVSTRCSLAT